MNNIKKVRDIIHFYHHAFLVRSKIWKLLRQFAFNAFCMQLKIAEHCLQQCGGRFNANVLLHHRGVVHGQRIKTPRAHVHHGAHQFALQVSVVNGQHEVYLVHIHTQAV